MTGKMEGKEGPVLCSCDEPHHAVGLWVSTRLAHEYPHSCKGKKR